MQKPSFHVPLLVLIGGLVFGQGCLLSLVYITGWDEGTAYGSAIASSVIAIGFGVAWAYFLAHRHTQHQQSQSQFLRREKMQTVSRLAAGIAHDFNNILASINGYAHLLRQDLDPETDASKFANNICISGERAAGLVSQIVALSRFNQALGDVKEPLPLISDLTDLRVGYGHVFVVDDDASFGEFLRALLEMLGYTVTSFANSLDALECLTELARRQTKIELLISDQEMPGMAGLELIVRVRRLLPEIKTILCTGGSGIISLDIAEEAGADLLVSKPIEPELFSQKLFDLLRSSGSTRAADSRSAKKKAAALEGDTAA
ncbi:MAG: response regulator [Alphaproteobacteria bacterium]|nr:response regulator [Alphaproteobacteria bacterium SS10]